MADRTLLVLAAVLEVGAGLALIVSPPIFVDLLVGASIVGAGVILGRVGGIALLSLGLACWPGTDNGRDRVQPVRAMLTYNSLVAAYLAYLGAARGFSGILLWPAVVIHGALAFLFVRAAWKQRSTSS
jgi:hypothetical protein